LLSYLLARRPDIKTDVITVPPVRMAAAIADGQIDAFWVGEPWGSVAVKNNAAAIVLTGSQIWAFAPEKVLAARSQWVTDNPEPTRAIMRAVYKAGQWLDQRSNAALAVDILARSEHLDLTDDLIDPAINGDVTFDPASAPRHIDNFLMFSRNAAQFPWRSQAAWIAAHLGADKADVDAAKQCFRSDLFRQNLGTLGIDLPGASEKVEGALAHETAVASTRGNMILGPDAFFDGETFDFGR
jgi:NitT/TauT family transport system ATP-binding protein